MGSTQTSPPRPARLWLLPVVGGFLFAVAGEGPDFGHYTDWAAAALSGDIFQLRGNVLSPGGVPFSLAAAGPGLLFAVAKAVLFPVSLGSAAIVAGWCAAIVFWACALVALRRLAGGHEWLAFFGAGALFTGTHAGLYSHAYATEAFADALVAALWAVALARQRWRVFDSALVGALTGLLLLVRAHVVIYAVPALWVAVFGQGLERPTLRNVDLRTAAVRLMATAIPIAIAAGQYALVNAWMTGSPLHPPYVYGGDGFSSVDLWHPELKAVLVHPWHGLLSYHPLYAVAMVATVVEAWRGESRRALWIATLLAAVAHVWVQAGWYIWWLGGTTFGMRGMAPAALPLVAGLVAAMRRDAEARPQRVRLWLFTAVVSCTWSYSLMLQGNTQFYTWGPLLSVQATAVYAILGMTALYILASASRRSLSPDAECRYAALALGVAVVAYLAWQLAIQPAIAARVMKGLAAAALVAGGVVVWGRLPREGARATMTQIAVLAVFVAQGLLFTRLALRTERHLAAGGPPPRPFDYVSASPVDELRVTYAEYRELPGFEDRKAALRHFLSWQRIQASPLSSADRAISETVRKRLVADAAFGDLLVEAVARNGVIVITARGMTNTQQSRARELARDVPGARAVTFSSD